MGARIGLDGCEQIQKLPVHQEGERVHRLLPVDRNQPVALQRIADQEFLGLGSLQTEKMTKVARMDAAAPANQSAACTIAASVVRSSPATDAASCSADRTTKVGSITPDWTRFS